MKSREIEPTLVFSVTGLEALKANETADQLEVQLDEMKSFEGEKLESALKKFGASKHQSAPQGHQNTCSVIVHLIAHVRSLLCVL